MREETMDTVDTYLSETVVKRNLDSMLGASRAIMKDEGRSVKIVECQTMDEQHQQQSILVNHLDSRLALFENELNFCMLN